MIASRKRVVPFVLVALVGALLVVLGAAPASAAAASSTFTSITPTRVLDTRDKAAHPGGPIPGGTAVPVSLADQVPADATAVAVNVTAVGPAGVGYLAAYPTGGSTPNVSNVNFVRNQTVANLAVVLIGTDRSIDLRNGSASATDALLDVSGYFAPSTGSNPQGSFVPVSPQRVLDAAAVQPGKDALLQATGSVVPSGVSAVVLNLTAVTASKNGYVTAYPYGAALPGASSVNFAPGQTVANLVVAPVGTGGKVAFRNGSAGPVRLLADISGYVLGGDPLASGSLAALTPTRLLDTRYAIGAPKAQVPAGHSLALTVAGKGGVPLSGVSAVVLELTAVSATRAGYVTAYPPNAAIPMASTLNLVPKQTVANLVLAPVSGGKVEFYNGSTAPVDLVADVSGYVLGTALNPPAVSTSRYVRNITGGAGDVAVMKAEGQQDAAAGSTFVLLDIGAQLNDKTGVQLSATSRNLTYVQLVTAVQAYLDGYGPVAGGTVAVGTNNGGDFTAYTASARGKDWADNVIDPLSAPSGVTVVGADDIEADFSSTELQAEQWETAYLANTPRNLVFVGAADGCPTAYGATKGTCNFGWTEAQHYKLAGGLSGGRIKALPQIYLTDQAVQWANIDATGGGGLTFAGALTENAACPTSTTPGCSFAALPPVQGWAALRHWISTVVTNQSVPALTDLRVDS